MSTIPTTCGLSPHRPQLSTPILEQIMANCRSIERSNNVMQMHDFLPVTACSGELGVETNRKPYQRRTALRRGDTHTHIHRTSKHRIIDLDTARSQMHNTHTWRHQSTHTHTHTRSTHKCSTPPCPTQVSRCLSSLHAQLFFPHLYWPRAWIAATEGFFSLYASQGSAMVS